MRAGDIGTTDRAKSPSGKGFGGIDAVASLSAISEALAACVFGLGPGGFSFAASTAAVVSDSS
jgi:O-glycosyl hydrolase